MLINILCYRKGHPHSQGSYNEIVWNKADVLLISPKLHQSYLKNISEAKNFIRFLLESFLCPVKLGKKTIETTQMGQ